MTRQIHLVFKTHLDIGFTDHAARVRAQYHNQFIPQAIATGEHFYAENPDQPEFIWTTGAWLIWDHLHSQDAERVKKLERAIERGLITWHALPFTTHTELMSSALFRAGLSFSQELDQRFGRHTTAAKMTDVPGHTLGMVPLLAEAGVNFLHLGVNTASPVPDVPPIFRWHAPGGEEIVVMYQASYGATDFPAGPEVGLSFAHTNDNIGPQSVGQTVEALRHIRHENPDAIVTASTLDAFGAEMWKRREEFPIVTEEIGDSWIHGTATDPQKLARFRALQRLYDGWEPTEARRAFGRGLTQVAEHTWGVDIKTYLRDDMAWDRADFDAVRKSDYRFAYSEQSWAEQRAYIDTALAELDTTDRQAADRVLSETTITPSAEPAGSASSLSHGGWTAELDPTTGSVAALIAPGGTRIAGSNGVLFGYTHESYDWIELQKHLDSYLQHRLEWAILDHDKPGLDKAKTARTETVSPALVGINGATAIATLPAAAHAEIGAPAHCDITLRGLGDRQVEITLTLRDKPANRMPEAGFFRFTPQGSETWRLKKLGLWHESSAIARKGGGQLQAVEAVETDAAGQILNLTLLDAALVAPATAPFIPFQPERPDFSGGLRVNLYNNKWGTNFPMWWEGAAKFRFVLTLG
ncbi:DUF5054 domain-containing protein [Devosia sp.]|uniref:DUF5054 domain-containing protein n=1 Tax=Devosia sp. TaxID=1871048 RepID=UPI001B1A7471|nr:DUF5054 domain-containing protein [Devosia sp.]MBO9591241.1 DUF5054 domain-containing protein [Devosia sp.]